MHVQQMEAFQEQAEERPVTPALPPLN